jgi:hypothetical protein
MKRNVLQATTLVAGLSASCSLVGGRSRDPTSEALQPSPSAQSARVPCRAEADRYTDEQKALIVRLRDNGASLREVAKMVGGTRDQVKRAERALRARRTREGPTAKAKTDEPPRDCNGLALR